MSLPHLVLEKVTIGGIDQWISMRGNPDKPVCLFLHGGPGLAAMPLLHAYCNELENDFLIVNWDQRGAGKTYSPFIQRSSMNLAQFIKDASDLLQFLVKRFDKKINLIGHSWGSALGMFLVQRHPDLLNLYIGVGQIGNWSKGEEISYKFTVDKAHELKNKRAVRILDKIGSPPHNWKKLVKQRQLLAELGGAVYGKHNFNELVPKYLFSKEYNLIDKLKFPIGAYFSLKNLWAEFTKIDLCKEVPEVQIPICFMLGKYDYQVPFECSVQYYDQLKAPEKSIIWFEKSGHMPFVEEPDKFIETARMKLKEYNG